MTPSSRKWGMASVSALALLLGIGAAWSEGHADQRAPTSTVAAPRTSGMSAPVAVGNEQASTVQLGSRWPVGAQRRYALDFGTRVDMNQADPSSWFSVVGSGTLQLTRVDSADTDGTFYLRGELTGFRAVLENEEHSGLQLESYIEKGLDKPFLLRVSESGRILALGSQSEVSAVGYNILRYVVGTLQFVEPSGPNPSFNVWETEESDQNGICKAKYRRKGGGGFEKTKLGYTYAPAAGLRGPNATSLPTVQSVTELVWKEGRLERAALVEALNQPFGDQASIKSKTHVTLQLASTGTEAPRSLETAGFEFLQLFQTKNTRQSPQERLEKKRALVAGASFAELNGLFAKLPDNAENRSARWRAAERLSALFELDPSALAAAVKSLRESSDSQDRDMLLNALSDADSPEARAALAELARDHDANVSLREDAIRHLGLNEKGSPEALQALSELATNPADAAVHAPATLALGAAAHAGASTDGLEDATERAVQTLSDGYKRATTPQEQRLQLAGLGNAGHSSALGTIRTALGSQEPTVRAAAADSLRRIEGREADELLASTIRHDPEPRVRMAAIDALAERSLSEVLVNALAETLRAETDGAVRQQVITLLTRLVRASDAARALLAFAAESDPVEDLRNAAARALKSGL